MLFNIFGKSRDEPPTPSPEDRVTSGIPRLDYILKGGFLKGGIYTVLGRPGRGETVRGNQFCFNRAGGGGRCVYMSLRGESHAKRLRNLATMKFFRAEQVPDKVYYV